MAAQRPEKQTVRRLWVEEVQRFEDDTDSGVPLYLTLPGEQGGDLRALADAGVVGLLESGAVAEDKAIRVVAVQQSRQAVVHLGREFPGLKILEQRLEDMLKATTDLVFPDKPHRPWFRAKVVNFDLNEALHAEVKQKQLVFPALRMVEKVAKLHAEEPCLDWTLCLTLHGEVAWSQSADELICRFLAANFKEEPVFSEQARDVLGAELHDAIANRPQAARVLERSTGDQQRVMAVLVPKRIAHDTHKQGWHISTVENLRYGGVHGHAPMVTWILRFSWDERASTEPSVVYREALRLALQRHGSIDGDGRLQRC